MKTRAYFFVFLLVLFASLTAIAQDSLVTSEIASFPYGKTPQNVFEKGPSEGDTSSSLISASTYQFSALSGIPLADMSSGTTQVWGPGTDNAGESQVRNIGFLYRFDGVFYTTFGISPNGFIRLGATPTAFQDNTNQIDSTLHTPKIAPYWDDLCVGNTGKVHYKFFPGPVGVQKLVVEWKNMKITRGTTCDGTGAGTFQLWIYDRTGVVQFVYGDGMTVPNVANNGYSIGIQAGAATNFASIAAFNSTVSYTTGHNNQITAIPSGTSYLLSPNIPAAVSNLAATPAQTAVTINWTDNANDETAYLVRRTTDHNLFYFVGNTLPANTTTFTDTGLATNTQYFYYVNALTDGAFGPDIFVGTTTLPAKNVASTAAGGPWSSPATWASGVLPDEGDDVLIADGATVTIDTAARARTVTVGSPAARPDEETGGRDTEGGAPAVLRFGETAAFSLTVTNDVNVSSNGTLSTGGGNANQHVLTVNGNILNNGVFDLSTNNNQAGAGLVFTGASNNTFSGTGPVTDIRTITLDKGTSSNNVLDVSVSNFSVMGSTTDSPAAGYLFLVNGTYKISGTFTANLRTFPNPVYQITGNMGFILNNPNYTVTAQHTTQLPLTGRFEILAGTFNVGTQANDSVYIYQGANVKVQGGRINVAGAFRTFSNGGTPFSYIQTGGLVVTCTIPGNGTCYDIQKTFSTPDTITISGGEAVVQNNGSAVIGNTVDMTGSNAVIRFGNEFTVQPTIFTIGGDDQPNVIIDTRVGPHILQLPSITMRVKSFEIGTGGTLDINNSTLSITGESVVNNGNITSTGTGSTLIFTGQNPVYSGSGTTSALPNVIVQCQSFTLDTSGSVRVRRLFVLTGDIVHSDRLIIGNNDATVSVIRFGETNTANTGGVFDAPPTFEPGPNGYSVSYVGNGPDRVTGPEISPGRVLNSIEFDNRNPGAKLNIAGGNLRVGGLFLGRGEIATGQFRLVHTGSISRGGGFVTGEVERVFTAAGGYNFPFIGSDAIAQGNVGVVVNSPGVNPSSLSVRNIPGQPLPGLLPATSVRRHWQITETGDLSGSLILTYTDAEIRGNESNYQMWRSTGGTPSVVPGSVLNTSANSIGNNGITDYTGLWGIGEMTDPGPVSISGSVLTSTGAGIRNAIVTISGGNLQSPVVAQTGQLGTYGFSGLLAGETYTVTVSAKRFRFSTSSRQVTPLTNVTGIDFTANPQEEF